MKWIQMRHMVYDAMSYLKEYREITRKYKESPEKKTEDEFLSKMRKDDRLHPVITLTVYYGEKQWDGPYCLKDMIVEMPEEIAAIFSDYKMNLLEVRDSGMCSIIQMCKVFLKLPGKSLPGILKKFRRSMETRRWAQIY